MLGDVSLLLLFALETEEDMVLAVDDSVLGATAAAVGSDGGRYIDDDRWSSRMGARWVWSEIIV